MNENKQKKLHYAWIILVFTVLSAFIIVGLCSNTLSLYVKPVSDANGFARGAFSLKNTFASLIAGCITLSYSKLTARFPLKTIIAAGIVCLMINYTIQANAKSLPLFYLSALFQGVGIGMASMSAMNILLNRWFAAKLGTMTGIMYTSTSIAGSIFFSLMGNMLASKGYQSALWLSVAFLAVYLVILLIVLVDDPKKKGLNPMYADEKTDADGKKTEVVHGLTFEEVKKSKSFIPSIVLIFLISICSTALQGTMTARFTDVGFPLTFATSIVSIMYIFTSISKIPAGMLADRIGILPVINFGLIMAICALAALLFVSPERTWLAYALTPFMGSCMILHTIPAPLFGPTVYGRKAVGQYMGIYMAATTFGGALGQWVWNHLYDITGSYNSSYIICMIGFAVAIVGFTVILKSQDYSWQQKKESNTEQ